MQSFADFATRDRFETLYALYQEKNNTDIQLVTEDGEVIHAHSFIIAAAIPKIREKIIGKRLLRPKLRHLTPLRLNGVKSQELRLILKFAYVRRYEAPESLLAVVELLRAAVRLHVSALQRMCMNDLINLLDPVTALAILGSANRARVTYHLAREHALRHLTACTYSVAIALDFKELISLLQDDCLHAPFEEMALQFALNWIECNKVAPQSPLIPQVLNSIRVGLLNEDSIQKLRGHPAMNSTSLEVLDHMMSANSTYLSGRSDYKLMLPMALRPRVPHSTILISGGASKTGACIGVHAYDHLAERWIQLPWMSLPKSLMYQGFHEIGNSLFLIGGTNGVTTKTTCFRLELGSSGAGWRPVSSMADARCFASNIVYDNQIYAFSGRNLGQANGRLVTCEKYNPATDTWTTLATCPATHSDAGIVVLNGQIHLLGGFDGESPHSTHSVYDPKSNSWKQGRPMSANRSGHSCVVHGGHIYIAGGSNGRQRFNSVKCYSPETDSWAERTPMLNARSNFASARLDNRWFVFGGFDGQGVSNLCEVYDFITDQWLPLPAMSHRKSGMGCCVVHNLEFSRLVRAACGHQETLVRDPIRPRHRFHPANCSLERYHQAELPAPLAQAVIRQLLSINENEITGDTPVVDIIQ